MATNPISRLRDFPAMIYCEPPELTGTDRWAVRGIIDNGVELCAEHPNLLIAIARFGTSYYKLKREANILTQAKRVT